MPKRNGSEYYLTDLIEIFQGIIKKLLQHKLKMIEDSLILILLMIIEKHTSLIRYFL